eukprot:TRINITY_DN20416_c0_g1_i1.p1 TRINITY_DN20416_c0_g1~~TRINITY_DN20416_c0_g1_i1.p1  ORF type:complete len:270 (+),score=67.02 TRINITY_DN20416_c0_g1_i1:118-927(+)
MLRSLVGSEMCIRDRVSTQSTGLRWFAMVFFYTICGNRYEELGITVFMGRDKHENEDLIRYGWPEDIWFHVDDYSSAHVYLRLPKGPLRKVWKETGTLDHLPEGILHDLCVLTKNNSIEGSKCGEVDIVYTPWENLHKRDDMDIGTIGFHNNKAVIKVSRVNKHKDDAKRLEKTKSDDIAVEFAKDKERRDRDEIADRKSKARQHKKDEEARKKLIAEEKERKSYDRMFTDEAMNKTMNAPQMADEDDFMGGGSDLDEEKLADDFADFL